MNQTPSDTDATMSDVITLLRTRFPDGGNITGQFHEFGNDLVLDLHQITSGSEGYDETPEDLLGETTYQRVSDLLHTLLDTGTLPGYTEGDKFWEFDF